jgi:ribosome maturation factor RimP
LDRVKLDKIITAVNQLLAPAAFDCIEAEWQAHDRILRLFVEHVDPAVGINLDGCVQASRLLLDDPDLDALVNGVYTLEVSSPGVERPLRRAVHFERHVGATIQVKLREKVQERKNGTGRIVRVEAPAAAADAAYMSDDTRITLETPEGPWSFPLASLQKASLVYDWGAG